MASIGMTAALIEIIRKRSEEISIYSQIVNDDATTKWSSRIDMSIYDNIIAPSLGQKEHTMNSPTGVAAPLFTTVILLHPTAAEAAEGKQPEIVYETGNAPAKNENAAATLAIFDYARETIDDLEDVDADAYAARLEVRVRPF